MRENTKNDRRSYNRRGRLRMKKYGIIEIGSNNTKTHIYEGEQLIYENNTTIELKKNYKIEQKIREEDLKELYAIIEKAKTFTEEVHIYGCSIFRSIKKEELEKMVLK